jgi:deoxyribonuclease IV
MADKAVIRSFVFGTVGSPKSTAKKPGGSVGAIQRLHELSLGTLELGWVQAVRVSEQTCSEIRAAGETSEITISVHAPYFINLNASDDEWPRSRKRLMDAAHFGNLAGATDIVFHPGSYFGQPPDAVMPKVIVRLRTCVEELQADGNPVTLRPETMGKIAMVGSLEDTLQMGNSVPGVLPCLDFAHLHARPGDGSMNTYDEWCKVLELYGNALGAAALHQLHIHLSGIQYGARGEREHLAFADADLDVKALMRALISFDGRGRILCESPAQEDDALFLQQTWDDISSKN